jgi:two-component system sensor histidine kinase QseC
MRSIRQFLVANLLIGVLFATNLAILSNLYFGYKTIRPHLDAQMVIMAYSLDAFLQDEAYATKHASGVNARVAHFSTAIQSFPYDDQAYLDELHRSLDNIQFKVFNHRGQLLASSPNAPKLNRAAPMGFGTTTIHQEKWRTFQLVTKKNRRIVIYHPHHTRLYIEENANTKAIIIILLTIPPLGLFLWIIISRSLVSIGQASREIKQRAHNNLNPISTDNIPVEIRPLIAEINSLFDRLHSNFLRESRFAADAAHELKTPLAALKTHVQVAQSMRTAKEIKTCLDKINQGVDRANHTIDQLLTLSRTMPDVHMNAHTLVPLSQVVKQVIAEHAPTALKRDIALSLNDQLPEDAVIFGHDIALQTLMNNLLDNAIRYSPDQTEIHVTLMADHDEYILEVVDQGPGIPQALRERVFERFYRVIGTQQTGTGLGLNIVHQIVALHKGKITLDSVDGGTGLKVRVTLPRPQDIHTHID